MKEFLRFVIKIYPRAWRERYGEEFAALLDDTGADAGIVLNIWAGAILMQIQRWKMAASLALLGSLALFAAFWWGGQRSYITPGTHRVFHDDGSLAANLVALLVFVGATITGVNFLFRINDRGFRKAARAGWIFAAILIPYMTAEMMVALLTPRTIVSMGDSYCWDSWCMGVQHVTAMPKGENVLYTAEVSIFRDGRTGRRVPAEAAKNFFDVHDERGRRFPLLRDSSFVDADVVVRPGESVKSSLAFLAPRDAREVYLLGHDGGPPWVYMVVGSDLAPLHRHTLLRLF